MKKAIIAMSGGVDSSVAALLTKESGDQCIGATMKLFHNEDVGIKKSRENLLLPGRCRGCQKRVLQNGDQILCLQFL